MLLDCQQNMDLHKDKFELLRCRTPQSKQEELPYKLEWLQYNTSSENSICPGSSVKDIGVHLSPDLK